MARLDAASYVLMLTGSTPEDAQNVGQRIDRAFRRKYSHSKACLSFRTAVLEGKKGTPDDQNGASP